MWAMDFIAISEYTNNATDRERIHSFAKERGTRRRICPNIHIHTHMQNK